SAVMTTIPYPVLGGATITVFGMITMTGIQLLVKDEMSARNMTIVGLALALSLGIASVPEAIAEFPSVVQNIIGGAPIVVAAITAFVLNIVIPNKSLSDEAREREAIEAAEAAESSVTKPDTKTNGAS
ncbi:MAG: purine permease, partial [Halomonas sp.]